MKVIGVDVGSGSVRAAVVEFDDKNSATLLASCSRPTTTYCPHPEWFEQNVSEIWSALVHCVTTCVGISGNDIAAIAFTSTCSLVIIEANSEKHDIIMWMDHRSSVEAQSITDTKNPVLDQVGGVCSPEFSVAKLLWLQRNQPERFKRAKAFLELPDYLTWRCLQEPAAEGVGTFKPSNCSVTCKWGYDGQNKRWPAEFYQLIGLGHLMSNPKLIGNEVSLPGEFLGNMTKEVAQELGLDTSCKVAVGSSIIDAHAGVLAMVALYSNEYRLLNNRELDIETVFATIAGTSTCHMVMNREKRPTPGVWGPYFDVILKDYYVREPGQTATGKLLEHIVKSHPDFETILKNQSMTENFKNLNIQVAERRAKLVKNTLHVNPSFHGNRCPLANPLLKGGVYGYGLQKTELVELYEATIEALAYETKFIVEELRMPLINTVVISGGLLKNEAYMQIHADVLGTEVIGMECGEIDMMLAGTAILGFLASRKAEPTLSDMCDIQFNGLRLIPYKPVEGYRTYHEAKYKCYREFVAASQKIQKIMAEMV